MPGACADAQVDLAPEMHWMGGERKPPAQPWQPLEPLLIPLTLDLSYLRNTPMSCSCGRTDVIGSYKWNEAVGTSAMLIWDKGEMLRGSAQPTGLSACVLAPPGLYALSLSPNVAMERVVCVSQLW